MNVPTRPISHPNRLLPALAAVLAVLALVLASVVATAPKARAQSGELPGSSVGQDDPVLLIAQRGADQISSMPLEDGTVSVETDDVDSPQGVIRHGDTLFVSEWDRVVSVPVGGGDVTTVATGLSSPRGLAVAGDTLYIADSANDRVVSVPVGGGDVEDFVTTGIDSPRGLVIVGETLFIADRHNDRVVTAPLDGEGPTESTEFASFNSEIGYLAVAGDTLYMAAMNGTIWSVPVTGGEPEEFATGLEGIRGMAVHADTLYIGHTPGLDEDDEIVSVPLSDGSDRTSVAEVEGINDIAIGVDTCAELQCLPVVGSLFGSLG